MDTIRVGIIGLGGICRLRHVPGFSRVPGVRLCAVANRTRASSEQAAAEYGIPDVHDDWRDLTRRDDLDLILVGTWPYLHCDASVAALETGKHVFCQARMARDAAEATRMCDAARNSNRIAGLCPVPFGMRFDKTMARILAEDRIGPVRHVGVRSLSNAWVDPEAPLSWRKDRHLSGLNVQTLGMFIEVVHRWFGWTSSVSAETFLYTKSRKDASGAEVDVRIPDQVAVNTVVGGQLPVQYLISGVSGTVGDAIDIYGEKSALHYDVARDILYLCEKGKQEPVVPRPGEEYNVDQWTVEEDFIAALRGGAPYHPDFEDGLRYMQVIQAIHDSADSGKRIALNL